MKSPLFLVALYGLVMHATSSPPARMSPDGNLPLSVANRVWAMETSGDLLSDAGRKAAAPLFIREELRPAGVYIHVISSSSKLEERVRTDHAAEVLVGFNEHGTIGPTLDFIPATTSKGGCCPTTYLARIELVLTNWHWEEGPNGQMVEVQNAPQWRIEKNNCGMYLTVDAAIRYLDARRQSDTDPAIQRRAAGTLDLLRRISNQVKH